ncbi:MAG: acyl-CoA dehydrogenase family protein [Microbacteriaceae bacterium]|nr:acyl-CoA dehydrogenase family protein [Microbacteriaceae bacterium]
MSGGARRRVGGGLRAGSLLGYDPLGVAEARLSPAARAALEGLREVLERDIAPLMAEAWEAATMPAEVLGALVPLRLMDPPGVDPAETRTSMFSGFRNYLLARTDVSVATLYNAQSGLFRTAVQLGADQARAAELDPAIRDFTVTGAFSLTEPGHGSDIARGMETAARRDGADWVIDGEKLWIGGATTADLLVVIARGEGDAVHGFLVPRESDGVSVEAMSGKVSLRPMQNARIRLDAVRLPESARLARIGAWRDVAAILRRMRSDVAWIATGLQAGALDAAVQYTAAREQFGRPLGGFQLVQERLARMLGNLTASLAMVVQLSADQDAGHYSDEASALAKMHTARMARETVALGRELGGGNGILLEHGLGRYFADAEAVYSYEGTHDITALIVGRGMTGIGAFG